MLHSVARLERCIASGSRGSWHGAFWVVLLTGDAVSRNRPARSVGGLLRAALVASGAAAAHGQCARGDHAHPTRRAGRYPSAERQREAPGPPAADGDCRGPASRRLPDLHAHRKSSLRSSPLVAQLGVLMTFAPTRADRNGTATGQYAGPQRPVRGARGRTGIPPIWRYAQQPFASPFRTPSTARCRTSVTFPRSITPWQGALPLGRIVPQFGLCRKARTAAASVLLARAGERRCPVDHETDTGRRMHIKVASRSLRVCGRLHSSFMEVDGATILSGTWRDHRLKASMLALWFQAVEQMSTSARGVVADSR